MDKVSIVTYCDIDYMRDQTLVPATFKAVPITVGDRTAKLDACSAHMDEVHRALEPFIPPAEPDRTDADTLTELRLADAPTGPADAPTGPATGAAPYVNPEGMQGGAAPAPGTVDALLALEDGSPDWWDAYRAWMDSQGIKWSYRSGVAYTPKSKSLFRAHLDGLRDERGKLNPEGDDL